MALNCSQRNIKLFYIVALFSYFQTACFVIAVFLHYLFLVAFSWMATEGVILYLMLVKVFPTSSEGPKKRLLFICSWGKLPCHERVVGWRRAAYQFGKRKISHSLCKMCFHSYECSCW